MTNVDEDMILQSSQKANFTANLRWPKVIGKYQKMKIQKM